MKRKIDWIGYGMILLLIISMLMSYNAGIKDGTYKGMKQICQEKTIIQVDNTTKCDEGELSEINNNFNYEYTFEVIQ